MGKRAQTLETLALNSEGVLPGSTENMRERTPSADDTPKRAPPAPLREAASADVLVDGRSARVVVADSTRTSKSALPSCMERRIRTMVTSTRGLDELASSQPTINDQQQQQLQHSHYHHNHNQYNQQQQHHHHHHHNHHSQERPVIGGYRQAQTAQDKRSRLSNVINNLRKKVPSDTASVHDSRRTKDSSHEREVNNQHREDEDDARNSVERNLANLEKYVMTVLNGVIKDAESKDEVKADAERSKASTELANDAQDTVCSSHIEILAKKEDQIDDPHAGSPEPSRPNESRLEAAVPPQPELTANKTVVDDKATNRRDEKCEKSKLSGDIARVPGLANDGTEERILLSEPRVAGSTSVDAKKSNDQRDLEDEPQKRMDNDVDRLSGAVAESRLSVDSTVNVEVNESARPEKEAKDQVNETKSSLSRARENVAKDDDVNDSLQVENSETIVDTSPPMASDDKRVNNRSLGTIILNRLTDHQAAPADKTVDARDEANPECSSAALDDGSESEELRLICRDLLNELLNDISQLIDDTPACPEDSAAAAKGIVPEDVKETEAGPELANTSIHCSLPLEKVASVLQNCQKLPDTSSSSSPSGAQQTSKAFEGPKPPSPTVRHLCLYCDRKFLSISLRQRHTDRVHQLGGGRRSERNSRKTTQNCQYCSDKCADSLDGLFQHMIGKHGDKYHACVECTTRYSTRDALVTHISDVHGCSSDKVTERQEKAKESSTFKEPASPASRDISSQSNRDKIEACASNDRRVEEKHEQRGSETTAHLGNPAKPNVTQSSTVKDVLSNPGSPEFDSSFYSSVSCNIRENLLHHLDGKLQPGTSFIAGACNETKSQIQSQQQQQQSLYEHSGNQTQFSIDISLTAATPVYSKEYGASDEYENSSEYAQKPGKTGRSHPRRVSFEKYNFPRKYDGKEQWSCSIKDLSKFDISTQLSLRKKQQVIKERLTISRLHHTTITSSASVVEPGQTELEASVNESESVRKNSQRVEDARTLDTAAESSMTGRSGRTSGTDESISSASESHAVNNEQNLEDSTTDPESSQDSQSSNTTVFTAEFGNFLKLRKWEECKNSEAGSTKEIVYAELTGEWSRPRIYICGACTSRHLTLREMEEHKAMSHPNVWCSHLEFTGDQRELYKHLFLPGRSLATTKAKNAVLAEKVCTKCSKICGSLAELHRHMLECGGDQAWLLGLFGNGKKKCKWRPFGSRSRRRRQRGMKRNIQNSQTPRVNQPRERNSSGPRVRPSDRESIQKMLANLPPKRASRRVMQETTVRTQGRLRKMQTRSRPRLVEPTPSNSRLSRKAVLRNKLLKHAKSFQRKICRGDNITAAIESVVKKSDAEEEADDESGDEEEEEEEEDDDVEDDSGRVFKESIKFESSTSRGETSKGRWNLESSNRSTKIVRGVRVVSKKRNVKSKDTHNATGVKARNRVIRNRHTVDNETASNSKNGKNSSKNNDKAGNSTGDNQADSKSQSSNSSTPSHSALQRRKKHVDPVISLHASLKARSQLRTHDGKFARTSDVRGKRSTGSVGEGKKVTTPASQNLRTRGLRQDPGRLVTRAKLRAARRVSNDAKVTRRTVVKKISSDSNKMPILEAADEKTNDEEKSSVKSVNELPIILPVATVIGKPEQKISRGTLRSSSASKVNSGNQQQAKTSTELDLDDAIEKNVIDVTQIKNSVQNTSQEQRPTRARRKNVVRDVKKSEEGEAATTGKDESPARVADSARDFRAKNRTSLPTRASSSTDYSEESSRRRCSVKDSKSREEEDRESVKKSTKSELQSPTRKNEASRPVDTRQARQARRTGSLEDFSKLQGVPDEVKKLLGSSDDPSAQIGLKKREKTKKNGRQPPKANANTPKQRVQKKNSNVDDLRADESEQEFDQKEKIGLRKSPRYAEKKNVASTIVKSTEQVESADESIEVLVPEDNSDVLEKGTKAESVSIEKNLSDELEDNPKANNSLGKRRGRIKSRAEGEDTELSVETEKEELSEKEKDESKETVNSSPEETIESTTDNLEAIEANSEDVPKELSTTDVAILSFEHLQQESNNSNIDSGKENSSETPVNVSKLKVVRPKKSRGLRRDRMAKRTLNNVIGILTEGVNIPVEVQQSVVLTVQTSIEGVTPETGVQSNPSQMADNNVAAGEVSNVRASVKPNESSDAACSSGSGKESEESATQVSQQIESETIENSKENCSATDNTDTDVQQIQCYSVTEVIPAAPIPAKPVDTVQSPTGEQPTNDIILDLSRRKPKGKGSFLEKIVSKIAKQKDALLESEVGCLLDHSAGELMNIIEQVSTARTPKENSATSKSSDKDNTNAEKVASETTIFPDTKQSKDDDKLVVPPVKSTAKNIPINQNEGGALPAQTMVTIDEPKNQGEKEEVQPTEEQTLGSGILPTSSQEFSTVAEPPVCPIVDERIAYSESKRTSKKRSLDAVTPKKNKRKTVEAKEGEKDSSDDEICLADIMELINRTKHSSPKINEKPEQKVRPGKRKTMELDKDESLPTVVDSNAESMAVSNDKKKFQSNVAEMNKKSKRNNAKKSQICEEVVIETVSDNDKPVDKLQLEKILENSELKTNLPENIDETCPEDLSISNSLIEAEAEPKVEAISEIAKPLIKVSTEAKVEAISEMAMPLIEVPAEAEVEAISETDNPLDPVDGSSSKNVEQPQAIDVEDKTKSRNARKRAAKKKSLADEHLDLSDDEPSEESCHQHMEELETPAVIDVASALNLSAPQVASPTVPAESFKVPESNEFLESSKRRRTKKKSLAAEHLELLDGTTHSLPSIILPSEPVDDVVSNYNTLGAEMEKDEKEPKEIVEEKRSSVSPPLENIEGEKSIDISTVMNESTVTEESEVKTFSNDESVVDDEEPATDEAQTDTSVTDSESIDADGDVSAEGRRSLTRKSKENAPITEELALFSDVKLQRKFAVVHTKSGKMLIVEKKKKFTKEAAKFFCEVCAASFTRKSSLKKHNSSQFHLLQLFKCGEEAERDGSMVEEDATNSSIDASNDVSAGVELTEEAKDPHTTNDDAIQIVENIEKPTSEKAISQDSLDEARETNEQEHCDIAIPLANQPEESTFGKQDLLEEDLEDELLDEEICKITENMTHDEYVLTDHVSPVLPEAASTPVINVSTKANVPEPIEKVKENKKERNSKQLEMKRNLADEHLDLDSPVHNAILADTRVSSVLEEGTQKSLDIIPTLHIPESSKPSSDSTIISTMDKQINEDKSGWCQSIASTKSHLNMNKSTAEAENVVPEKPSRSRRKHSKKSVGKEDSTKNKLLPEEEHDSLSRDVEISIVSAIDEKSTAEPEEVKDVIENANDEPLYEFLPKVTNDFKEPVKPNSTMTLDFSNITEKLKAQESSVKDTSCTTEFDSSEDSSDTNMSDDIRKILDDPELDTDNKSAVTEVQSENEVPENLEQLKILTPAKEVDIVTTNTPVTSVKKNKQQKTKSAEVSDEKIVNNKNAKQCMEEKGKKTASLKTNEKKLSRSKNTVKEPTKKSRATKLKRNNNSSKNKAPAETSDSEYDEKKDGTESQNKSKIVKCVFGRVFGGEKVDKVKEVLDDWVSRSEGDSQDDFQTTLDLSTGEGFNVLATSPPAVEAKRSRKDDEKSTKRRSRSSSASKSPSPDRTHSHNRKRARSKNSTREKNFGSDDPNGDESSTERRSRSKSEARTRRRNTEKKTNDSTSAAKPSESVELKPSSRSRQSKTRAREQITRFIEDDVEFDALISGFKAGGKIKKKGREEADLKTAPRKQPSNLVKSKKRLQEEAPEGMDEAQGSEDENKVRSTSRNNATLSSKRERSPSPDDNSQKTLVSMNDEERSNTVEAEEEDENEIALGRLSPLYVCNSPASSKDSDTNSEENERENRTRGRSTSEFSGEKVVIRSPPSSLSNREDRTEVVTIAPTDAIEDNALDVPREIATSPGQKPRQGKVLNFDEELFVECCSRLKATTENELRGAKKIKLDHSEVYNRNEDQGPGFRGNRDRWRDVESQNSLGSLLESVNQLLGEEMYSGNRTNEYPKRGRNVESERSSRTASPEVDANRQETLGYEDSLDVAFEHNNKLRVKIQQRMRESENLIASTFSQKSSGSLHRHHHHHHHRQPNHQRHHENSHQHHHRRDNRPIDHGRKEHAHETDRFNDVNQSSHNGENYVNLQDGKSNDRSLSTMDQTAKHVELDCSNFRSKNPALGGLLDKALSNLLHSNGKHDHNGSTPMNVLAELACARVPTATIPEVNSLRDKSSAKSPTRTRDSSAEERDRANVNKDPAPKKARNPIKELFERKKFINERKQHHQERSEGDIALRELNVHKQKKSKKPKRQQQQQHDFPLIRKGQLGGMVERKKRRDGAERKAVLEYARPERIKDVYDFDEEESQPETGPVLSYRIKNDKSYEVLSCGRTKEFDMTDLMTKTIGDTLNNGKAGDALGRRLESMINRKFQEIETYAPKTKGALKSFHMEEKQQQQQEQKQKQQQQQEQQSLTGPMDDFVERKQRSRKLTEQSAGKHGRSKRRSKNSKKKSRNAWYENDSSDEFRTAAKAEDVGVGITKSQRTCSKGKQNLFAELSTSSESEYADDEVAYEAKRRFARLNQKKIIEEQRMKEHRTRVSPELADNYPQEQEDHGIVDWMDVTSKTDSKNDLEHKKSESEMSDHPLVIDERKTETDEPRNSDDDTETRYNPTFELDDLYREDSSVADSDPEEEAKIETEEVPEDSKAQPQEEDVTNEKSRYSEGKELIPLEEALDLLDNNEDLANIPERLSRVARTVETLDDREESLKIVKEGLSREDDETENEELENKGAEASMPEEADEDLPELPEKLSSNEKPPKESENLPLHVFLSRKVQESKKRKQQQQKKMQEEQEKILMEFAPTRRQRKCAIGKQGLLAEISSSDEESYARETCRRSAGEKSDHERQSRKPKRESKEKRKERYMEKKHEQIIAKEQKAIEEEILREVEKTKGSSAKSDSDSGKSEINMSKEDSMLSDKSETEENQVPRSAAGAGKKKRQQKPKKAKEDELRSVVETKACGNIDNETLNTSVLDRKSNNDESLDNGTEQDSPSKPKRQSKSSQRPKKSAKTPDTKASSGNRKSKISNSEKAKSRPTSTIIKDPKERRSSSGKRDSDDEELRTTKCWNKVEEGVGVAIGRRKRAAANQLYYWSSSSDDDEPIPASTTVVEEEDDRQEQHGWIVGDSHKRMITMLAMEKQLKEKRRRSEDEFEPGKTKNKKHRNSTS